MKCLLVMALALATPCFSSSLWAQATGEKKRLVFPADGSEPQMPSPSPTPSPAQPLTEETPEQALAIFFRALAAGEVDGAYDRLIRGTTIAERAEDVKALKERTRQALDVCGPFNDYEVLEERAVGRHLMRWTCLSLHTDLPLRWRFYFYQSQGRWRLVDLRVDDGLVELFEDGGRRGR